jgi:hypothetical protein
MDQGRDGAGRVQGEVIGQVLLELDDVDIDMLEGDALFGQGE